MTSNPTAVALAVRLHPRGGAASGDQRSVESLKRAAAAASTSDPGLLSGPSSLTSEGVLLLPLSGPGRVMEAVLSIAEALRPVPSTYCAAVDDGDGGDVPGRVESALIAAQAATARALRGIESTDARERRVALLTPDPDPIVSALAAMILATYDSMTDRQRQMIALIKDSETQQQVARHLGVTRQAVNQSLAAAGWPYLRRAEDAIRTHLDRRERVPEEMAAE